MERPVKFRQGDNTKIVMEVTPPLREGHKLKVGIYSPYGKPLFETYYPDEGNITKVDNMHFMLELRHEVTRKMKGATTLRFVIYTADRTLVNAGEKAMPIEWEEEPATQNLI